MNVKERYEKRLDFQSKMISRQSNQIDKLKSEIENLKTQIQEKDNIINSVTPLKNELAENVAMVKEYKKEYKKLIDELKNMKKIIDLDVYNGRWNIAKFLIK